MEPNLIAAADGLAATLAGASWAQTPAATSPRPLQKASPMAQTAIGTVKSMNVAGRSATTEICCCTHDVLQSRQAMAILFAQLRPGAWESIAGRCLLPTWGNPVNAWMLWGARHFPTTWRGLRAPWVPLLDWCRDLRIVERYHWGNGYLAAGTVRSR